MRARLRRAASTSWSAIAGTFHPFVVVAVLHPVSLATLSSSQRRQVFGGAPRAGVHGHTVTIAHTRNSPFTTPTTPRRPALMTRSPESVSMTEVAVKYVMLLGSSPGPAAERWTVTAVAGC